MLSFFLWYLIISALGLMTFPLAYRLLPVLPDRGYAFTAIVPFGEGSGGCKPQQRNSPSPHFDRLSTGLRGLVQPTSSQPAQAGFALLLV
ncbi:MAG: hypothetical protein ABIG63_18225 [Chloroflexota bacterium]